MAKSKSRTGLQDEAQEAIDLDEAYAAALGVGSKSPRYYRIAERAKQQLAELERLGDYDTTAPVLRALYLLVIELAEG